MTEDEICMAVYPAIQDVSDAFDVATARLDQYYAETPAYDHDGYFDSHLMRHVVRNELRQGGHDLVPLPNTGIEFLVPGIARVKVLRSGHDGEAPRPAGLRRSAYCSTSQGVAQPMLPPTSGGSAESFWLDSLVSLECDGLAHLILDWELRGGQVVMHLSEPAGTSHGVLLLAWRRRVEPLGGGSFVPTDEEISIFDEDREVMRRCSVSAC